MRRIRGPLEAKADCPPRCQGCLHLYVWNTRKPDGKFESSCGRRLDEDTHGDCPGREER